MARKRSPRPPTLWDEAEEVPRAGIPSTVTLERRMKWGRRVIWAVVVAFPFVVISLFVTASSLKSATDLTPEVVEVDADARAAAMTAVTDWLTGDAAPVVGGVLVSWDEATTMPAFVPRSSDGATSAEAADRQVHALTARDDAGMRYRVEVLVATNSVGEVAVIGTPSLLPVAPSSQWAAGVSPWPNHRTTTAPDPVGTAVGAWVEAFTSGDPAKLRLTVGDPDPAHAYMPMTGAVGADHEVTSAAWVLDGAGEQTDTLLVQVRVRFDWPDVDNRKSGRAGATYDLLVQGADSAAPRVVAWGGPGTGPVLEPFGNAVVGRELQATAPPQGDEPFPGAADLERAAHDKDAESDGSGGGDLSGDPAPENTTEGQP